MEDGVGFGRSPPSAPTSAFGLKLGGDLARGTARGLAPTALNLSCAAGTGREVRARCDGRRRAVETRAVSSSARIGLDCEYRTGL